MKPLTLAASILLLLTSLTTLALPVDAYPYGYGYYPSSYSPYYGPYPSSYFPFSYGSARAYAYVASSYPLYSRTLDFLNEYPLEEYSYANNALYTNLMNQNVYSRTPSRFSSSGYFGS